MDGVLVDSEPMWHKLEQEYIPKIFGQEIFDQIGSLVGVGISDVVERAQALGSTVNAAEYALAADEMARRAYIESPITENIDTLAKTLDTLGYHLGVVTQSPQRWIDLVVPRLSFRDKIGVVISLYEHPDLKRKPSPDGYASASKQLNSLPENSMVLEDSNMGIAAGKAAGCFVIGYRGNLIPGYQQTGADAYANSMSAVVNIVEERLSHQ